MRFLHWLVLGLVTISTVESRAYNGPGHDLITRRAWAYLVAHPESFPAFTKWIAEAGDEKDLALQILVRNATDIDFWPDSFAVVGGYGPVSGGAKGTTTAMMTSFFHFMVMQHPGRYWPYDGFSYRNAWGLDFDQLLRLPKTYMQADWAPPVGGQVAPGFERGHEHFHGHFLGEYLGDFKGTREEFRAMYRGRKAALRATMPPATVPARLGWDEYLSSDISSITAVEEWSWNLPVVTGLKKGMSFSHLYRSGRVKGLPERFERLGVALHMVQDLTVPHHTQGTLDFCHDVYEKTADELICGYPLAPSVYDLYRDGKQAMDRAQCQVVISDQRIGLALDALAIRNQASQTLEQEMIGVAQKTGKWLWGDPVRSVDAIGTVLPDRKVITADRCEQILRVPLVRRHMANGIDEAVAATIRLLEKSSEEYLLARLNLFR